VTQPALLAISHGTASARGQAAIQGLVDGVAERLPEVTVRLGHVDVHQPDVAASLAALRDHEHVVIVPLLLSAGYHVRVDLITQSAGRDGVTIAPALGPDPSLVDVLVQRLGALIPQPADRLVLVAAGSSDERANEDCRVIGRMLAERLSRTVSVGFLAAVRPTLAEAVAEEGAHGERVVVANYLLAPGYFHDLAVKEADGAHVAEPLLDGAQPPTALVELVVDRYRSAS
jgi:sirohydrochlorin ferrochelatase